MRAEEKHPLLGDTDFGFLNRNTSSQRLFNPALLANHTEHTTMLKAIRSELQRADNFEFSVAFITSSALALLKQDLLDFQGRGVIYTSTYLDFNSPDVFRELMELKNIEVRVLDDSIDAFHSKGYIFHQNATFATTTAIIGSSNLTRSALLSNEEWNLKFSAFADGDVVLQLQTAIQRLHARSHVLTPAWIEAYQRNRKQLVPQRTLNEMLEGAVEQTVPVGEIRPNAMQAEALAEIKKVADAGEKRALVVSATGTGKTILAALATRQFKPQRVLFVVHREQILDKAIQEFRKVLEEPLTSFGKYAGSQREPEKKFVFAMVQTISKPENLQSFAPDAFDLIIIDEVHRAGAPSYKHLIDHFDPAFLLGLTATPERSDGFNVYELFDFNVPYEIRLNRALEEHMLVPFSYFGVTDYQDDAGQVIDETSKLAKLVMRERVEHVVQKLEQYGLKSDVRGLIFCSRTQEALQLSRELNRCAVNGKLLRTQALIGGSALNERDDAVARLEAGELDYILTVDLFNEGIDIPQINQVVMLRNTASSIIFTQQLGRGLRKAAGKTHLRVIDFIGNYKNNFLIPIALFGDRSLNKDSVRRHLMNAQENGAISGVSSISFDEISQKRVLESLASAKLDSVRNLREAFKDLQYRLNRVPDRYDFARFDTATPTAFISSNASRPTYWHFLKTVKAAEEELSENEQAWLSLFDREFLNGKRPHELLLARYLLDHGQISRGSLEELYRNFGASVDEHTLESVSRFFSLEFFSDRDMKRYGAEPLATYDHGVFKISADFSRAYEQNAYFAHHIDDSIETGLYLNQHSYSRLGQLLVGERYSRRDVCRLLNWPNNHESTMYGYPQRPVHGTCPIFITYHKDEGIDDAIKYQDHLDSVSTLSWFTRHGKTVQSKLESEIIAGQYQLDIFVKKDDAEGSDFIYLGQANPRDARNTTILANGEEKPIVNMKLDFAYPLDAPLFDYLTKDFSAWQGSGVTAS